MMVPGLSQAHWCRPYSWLWAHSAPTPAESILFSYFFFLTAFSCVGALWQRGQGLPYSGLGLVSKRLYMAQPVPPGLETISSSIKKVFLFEAPYALRDVLTT